MHSEGGSAHSTPASAQGGLGTGPPSGSGTSTSIVVDTSRTTTSKPPDASNAPGASWTEASGPPDPASAGRSSTLPHAPRRSAKRVIRFRMAVSWPGGPDPVGESTIDPVSPLQRAAAAVVVL